MRKAPILFRVKMPAHTVPSVDKHSSKTGMRTILVSIQCVDISVRNTHYWNLTGLGFTSTGEQYVFEDVFENTSSPSHDGGYLTLDSGLQRLCIMTGCESLRGMTGRPLRLWIPDKDNIRPYTAYAYGTPWDAPSSGVLVGYHRRKDAYEKGISDTYPAPPQPFLCSRKISV